MFSVALHVSGSARIVGRDAGPAAAELRPVVGRSGDDVDGENQRGQQNAQDAREDQFADRHAVGLK